MEWSPWAEWIGVEGPLPMGGQDVTSSLMILVIVFTILHLLVAFQAVHADYYGPRPPVTPTPYVPKPWMMDPTSGPQACLSASCYFETAG